MAWEETEIVIADATMKCSIKRDNDKMIIEMPFLEGVSVGDDISINGKKHIINDFEDIGNRNEILRLEIQNDKSVQRGTGSKSRKQVIQDENDS